MGWWQGPGLRRGCCASLIVATVALAGTTAASTLSHRCELVFVLDELVVDLVRLGFEVSYPSSELGFPAGACTVSAVQDGAAGAFSVAEPGALEVTLERANGLRLGPLAICLPQASATVAFGDLSLAVVEAKTAGGADLAAPLVAIDRFDCAPTTTTTTLPAPGCGDADGNGSVTAGDALAILRAAVGLGACPASVCDTDASDTITAVDALRALRVAVGLPELLHCS